MMVVMKKEHSQQELQAVLDHLQESGPFRPYEHRRRADRYRRYRAHLPGAFGRAARLPRRR